MSPKNIVIAGSIGTVIVGLVVVGVLVVRKRVLEPTPPSSSAQLQPEVPGPVPDTSTAPAPSQPEPQGLKDVVNAPPDYTGGADTDNDGLNDLEEAYYDTDSRKSDTDADGYSDYDEVHVYGTNPTDAKATPKTVQGRYNPNKGQPAP